jgi:hypothetical protein
MVNRAACAGPPRRAICRYIVAMAPPEVRADPVEVTRVAAQMLLCSEHLADAWSNAQAALAVAASAFGNSAGGPGVHASHQATIADADVAVGRLVAVLEGDTDRLYRIAFAYQKADDDADRRLRHRYRNIAE